MESTLAELPGHSARIDSLFWYDLSSASKSGSSVKRGYGKSGECVYQQMHISGLNQKELIVMLYSGQSGLLNRGEN
jgi:hypothetical protein